MAASRPDRRAGYGSPTVAGPVPRGVPLHRGPDPTTEDAGRTPGENPEAADIPRGGARVQRIGRPIQRGIDRGVPGLPVAGPSGPGDPAPPRRRPGRGDRRARASTRLRSGSPYA